MNQVIIGFTTEGTTDVRLLESIIERTFIEVGFECTKQIEVVSPLQYIEKSKGEKFADQIVNCCKEGLNQGVMILCVHADADSPSDDSTFQNKIRPAFDAVEGLAVEDACKNLVAIVPIQMTEAWMLLDKKLFKEEIGTELSDADLGIIQKPENIADPKAAIADAIRIARSTLARRRRKDLTITDLYKPLGQKISLAVLETAPSYMKFKESVREAYRRLNYLT